MKTSEQFALNQWLSDYPEGMSYQEILELMHGYEDEWTHDLITKWEVVEHFTMHQVIQFIEDTRKAFDRTIKTMQEAKQ